MCPKWCEDVIASLFFWTTVLLCKLVYCSIFLCVENETCSTGAFYPIRTAELLKVSALAKWPTLMCLCMYVARYSTWEFSSSAWNNLFRFVTILFPFYRQTGIVYVCVCVFISIKLCGTIVFALIMNNCVNKSVSGLKVSHPTPWLCINCSHFLNHRLTPFQCFSHN